MRALLEKDKRAVSDIVAYVLLITMTITISALVYGWLKYQVDTSEVVDCPEGVGVVVKDYSCSLAASNPVNPNLTVVLENKGRFSVDGYKIWVHDRDKTTFGFYVIDETGVALLPDEEVDEIYYFPISYYKDGVPAADPLTKITFLEVQPRIVDDDGKKVFCKSESSQTIICS